MGSPLVDSVATLLREVGEKTILPRFGALAYSDIETKSGPTDFVTVADREAEKWLTPRLRELVDCPVIGEEACAETPSILEAVRAPRAWTVDPVDGTSNFVKGNGGFCSMVALLEHGVPVASWIWVPLTETLYTAAAGDGAMLVTLASRRMLKVTGKGALELAEMIGGGNALGISEPRYSHVRAALRQLPGRTFSGSSGILGAEIASGKQHFLFHGSCTPWDHAPVDLLCREAGAHAAMVTDAAAFSADRNDPFLITPTADDWRRVRAHVWGDTNI